MSHVIQFKNGKKLHLVKYLMSSDDTVCGKKLPPGNKIHHTMPEGMLFCKGCHEWVGKQLMGTWLGTDFFDKPKQKTARVSKELRRDE